MDTKLEEQANAALIKWSPLANAADESRLTIPLHVALGEALDVATMLTHYWEPRTDTKGNTLPEGLSKLQGFDIALIDEAGTWPPPCARDQRLPSPTPPPTPNAKPSRCAIACSPCS